MDNFKYAIALTGGIATGKSTVANLFKLYGFLTIDADKIAHRLLDENSDKISEIFSKEFVENKKVLRKKLGKLIFSDKEAKKKLESLLHPLIKKEIEKEALVFEKAKKPYLIDIPLFFENRNYDIKKSIVVYAPKELQLQRIIKRDNILEEDAIKRIEAQMDIEKKKDLATYLIDNSKDLKHLQKEVDKVVNKLINY